MVEQHARLRDRELFRSGQIGDQDVEEPPEQEHPCMFREHMIDDSGAETHDFWEAAATVTPGEHLLPAGAQQDVTHTRECAFYPPLALATEPPAFVDIKIRMRPMGIDVLNDLVSTGHLAAEYPAKMPTFTVLSRRATYDPVKRRYGIPPADDDPSLGDCRTYLCMLDPQSPECVRKR